MLAWENRNLFMVIFEKNPGCILVVTFSLLLLLSHPALYCPNSFGCVDPGNLRGILNRIIRIIYRVRLFSFYCRCNFFQYCSVALRVSTESELMLLVSEIVLGMTIRIAYLQDILRGIAKEANIKQTTKKACVNGQQIRKWKEW